MSFLRRLSDLEARIKQLQATQQWTFALCCCERIAPLYRIFVEQEHWGNYDVLDSALAALWKGLDPRANIVTISSAGDLLSALEVARPAPEDFPDSWHKAPAFHCVSAISEPLKFILDGDVQHLVLPARFALEALWFYADRGLGHENTPLLALERDLENEDLKTFEKDGAPLTNESALALRSRARDNGLRILEIARQVPPP